MQHRFESFSQFWLHYVRQHQSPACRALHFIGSSSGLLCLALFFVTGVWWWLLAAPLVGYGISWIGHFAIERNRPAAFAHPVWSLAADFKMWALMLTRRMGREVEIAAKEV